MARDPQLAFDALSIEGGLLSPEWLSKVAQLEAPHQSPADYRIPKGLALRDEIGRFWRIAQAHWAEFKTGIDNSNEKEALAVRFVTGLLRDAFGFASLAEVRPVHVNARTYPLGLAALGRRVPVVVAPAGSGVDTLSPAFGEEGRRRSAFGLAQEYLNAEENAVWGLASDGMTLRLCRDNSSLTRPAWIEADLQRIFTEERYADFAALWLLVHETRFVASDRPAIECPLETWRSAGREQGTRAREKLRDGVEEALVALGRGFLSDNANQGLRAALHDGTLTRDAYFQQLLRLVYRIIFLLTAEERGVLHAPDASAPARELYEKGFALRRLRDRSVKRSAHDRFGDVWEGLKIVLRGLAKGEPRLGLPALGGLFSPDQCPHLDSARLENRWLMAAVFKLSWIRDGAGLARVNWRDMGPEELGSVYESLLELVPQIPENGRGFSFATGDETKGNARKTTGSYYTPDSLVQALLDTAFEPVVQATIAAHPKDTVEALLNLSIVDPAAGSGHFLLAAGRRLAAHVARLQAGGTPSAAEYRHALRQVVSRCLFGVDLNPMAVELCRVSLWMEAVEPGRPLSFLDSHIQQGNALLGTTPELMAKGIPDAAFDPIEGDDKKTASLLKKKNKAAAEGQRGLDALWSKPAGTESAEVARAVAALDAAPDASLEDVAGKTAQWNGIQRSGAFTHQKFVADAWCAAFVWPKPPNEVKKADPVIAAAPTNDLWRQMRDGQGNPPAETLKIVAETASQYQFFHWHLAFPQVFARGGFDVVLGNPPWERLTLRDQEWFAGRDPEVANAGNAAERRRKIRELQSRRPELAQEFFREKRRSIGEKNFSRNSGYFPLAGVGDVNTFALFAETFLRVMSSAGYAGAILPSGIATTDTTKAYFSALVKDRRLRSLYDFDNRSGLFPAVQGNVRFCLLTFGPQRDGAFRVAAQLTSTALLRDQARVYELSADDIIKINPGTLTCPLFVSARDAAIVRGIYRNIPVLEVEEGSATAGWRVAIARMLHMGDDAEHFKTEAQLREMGASQRGPQFVGRDGTVFGPLYESKFCGRFNHRVATFDGIPVEDRFGTHPATRELTSAELADPHCLPVPRYWAPVRLAEEWAHGRRLLLGFRNAVSATADSRSLNACIMPLYPAGDSVKFITTAPETDALGLVAILNSFVVDYVFRQKATGGNASFFLIRQLPVLKRAVLDTAAPWDSRTTLIRWLVTRVIELSCTTNDMAEWSLTGRPYRFDPERRAVLTAELDAAVFHSYNVTRSDADYILGQFPVLERAEVGEFGEYRSRKFTLDIYDAMAEAIRTANPYQTRLDPPPADPRAAHPESTRPAARARKETRS